MESRQRARDRTVSPAVALCSIAPSSVAGVYVFTQSVPVTVIAAVVTLGLAAVQAFPRR
ncbi:hypothetical protein ACWT_3215 [Actinoplanes sp. SE50]|uniref:hypothetical protein n=1 Tax=unclassified Actinoplanes TaxID=2626549 RepID=UPI00023EC95E|nr:MULTISPECIES: hypothetical protein [unclassified Actinoplanes]AEV84238.1 hypothetical protein ACPL_3343 [Actinoplanes sp. SE50/110]ATO82630.1 hypothetical protein ACWT_3215 [Actinoplanes sp. SE50]SLM00037.1 hypothetical protein ACSP50_3269 [Actinoplanes sp. SE50/110]